MEWPSATYIGMAASKWCNEAALRLAIVASQCKRFWASSGMQISSLISWTPSLPISSSCLDVHARLTLSSSGRQLVILTSNSSGSPVNMLHQCMKKPTLSLYTKMNLQLGDWDGMEVQNLLTCRLKCHHRQGQMVSFPKKAMKHPQ